MYGIFLKMKKKSLYIRTLFFSKDFGSKIDIGKALNLVRGILSLRSALVQHHITSPYKNSTW